MECNDFDLEQGNTCFSKEIQIWAIFVLGQF